jgi:hypothetical protein
MVLIATDFLSSRKLPNAPRILPIVPGKDKQIRPALSVAEWELTRMNTFFMKTGS